MTTSTNSVPDILLNNGQTIPQFGFGVFQIKPEDTAKAVTTALDAGYRHLDTAEMYGNEKETGQAVAEYDIDRADVFITSKLNNGFHEPDVARKAFDETLAKLGTDYIDLFLIHWPLPTRYGGDYVSTWKTLEEFYRDGRARSIGVSNFQPHHLRRLHEECDITPAVNQIEVHPFLTQDEVRGFCADHQIAVEAWSPIAQGGVLDDPTIGEIAKRVGKTPAQVVLRWHIERQDIVFPKSVTPERIRENIDIFDFELEGADVAAISALNKNERTGPDPDVFDYIPD
ncbi:aldo/keto reductase [Jatrophihabitans endophyticus]|uniref:aldo/keto reductase n=1 Tax=Jatrophihabitans endophyticus TaxID=1206085 RepID=UPI001A059375|nr:aldo/keto reductase [Jatrophihabitans endophyticus]MBE7190570.1 aldo/keto reductase [Jatrophihabitans endophyticus]